jgi:hypothetical protein
METKHTPGPWTVLKAEPLEQNAWHVGTGEDPSFADVICRVIDRGSPWSGVEGQANSEANAQLIAAAPELLEALQRIVERAVLVPCKNGGMDAEKGEGMDGGKWRVESSVDGWIVSARAAIAKATTTPVHA